MSDYDDSFPTCVETNASLRIFSQDIDPKEVTNRLGIIPSASFIKGEIYGQGLHRRTHGWFLRSEHAVTSKDTRRHIDWILAQLAGRDAELSDLRRRGCEMDVSCLWVSRGQGGPVLSPLQMRLLSSFELEVWWDVYFQPDLACSEEAGCAHTN